MRRSFTTRFALVGLLCMACSSIYAQEFSANIVNTYKGDSHEPSKIYVSKDVMRIDSADKERSGSIIMNYDTQVMDVIMPERHMYFETKLGQGPGQQRAFKFFQTINVENACPDWERMSEHKGGSCHRLGDEMANGRSAVKYETTSSDGKQGQVWIDKSLKFPVKWQDQDSSGELQNIQEGSQPSSLFEIPAGYQKLDMGNMMGHMPQQH
jgi:outer membrane lipoprotein-sorting protein